MNINVHIERITLEGVDWQPAQRVQFERALAGELSRLLQQAAQDLMDLNMNHAVFTSQNLSGLSADAALPANPTPRSMGVQVAQSVFNAMQDT